MTAQKNRINVIIRADDYDNTPEYLSISKNSALDVSDKNWGTGVRLDEVYWMPKSERLIAEFYSIWDDGHGACSGRYWEDHTGDVRFCKKARIDPESVGITATEIE